MTNKVLITRVNGVTFEGRQEYLKQIRTSDPCRIVPEPDNPYDPNALAIHVSHDGQIWHVGFIPKELAAEIAPHLEGEALMVRILEVTGGFETSWGETAALGMRIRVEVPGTEPAK